jgi:hypothetical protein
MITNCVSVGGVLTFAGIAKGDLSTACHLVEVKLTFGMVASQSLKVKTSNERWLV